MRGAVLSRAAALCGVTSVAFVAVPEAAFAHVKWFCAYSIAGQPAGLANVLCEDFESLSFIAVMALLFGALVERSFLGSAMNRALARVFSYVAVEPDVMVRAGVGLMMVSVWVSGGIILTPELKTSSTMLPWLQLAIAACLIDRRTLPLAAMGIVTLFAIALANYGAFHLADYPVFLGVAAYLAAVGLNRSIFGRRPIDVLRWSIAVTLMWASVEKWAYPQWTYPLFVTHPGMSMGFDPAFFMRAAGVVEFAMAFALLLTPFTRRCAAIMLAATFISAVSEFGKLDAIGHAGVIGVLFALILDEVEAPVTLRKIAFIPPAFAGMLAGFITLYYVSHTLIYGSGA